jgi:hypothetical protein
MIEHCIHRLAGGADLLQAKTVENRSTFVVTLMPR